MKNQWLLRNKQRASKWMFSVSENATWKLKPRIVGVPNKPSCQFVLGEQMSVVFPDVVNDIELITFLADCHLSFNKKTRFTGYLKLLDASVQSLETWMFTKITPVSIDYADLTGIYNGDIELTFHFDTKEYRDFRDSSS